MGRFHCPCLLLLGETVHVAELRKERLHDLCEEIKGGKVKNLAAPVFAVPRAGSSAFKSAWFRLS